MLQNNFIYSMIKLIFLIAQTVKTSAHTPRNNTDVIITYEGHAEAIPRSYTTETTTKVPDKNETTTELILETEKDAATQDSDVVFVPNEKVEEPVRRAHERVDEDGYLESKVELKDLVGGRKTLDDIVHRRVVAEDTEPPPDIFFVRGKNTEDVEEEKPHKPRKSYDETRRTDVFVQQRKKDNKAIVVCSNLDCNNTVNSFCGGKIEHKRWRFRLFRNECYFNKVNCAFSDPQNRYTEVPVEKCRFTGIHAPEKNNNRINYNEYLPPMLMVDRKQEKKKEEPKIDTRRFISSRRSLSVSPNGDICSHLCPSSCPDDYEPQCAVSTTGHKKVFANHCLLDSNSCAFRIVWHVRPLTDCVGHTKADLHQNRAFIGWMQRVGIVDKKGKLVLS